MAATPRQPGTTNKQGGDFANLGPYTSLVETLQSMQTQLTNALNQLAQFPSGTPAQLAQAVLAGLPLFSATNSGQAIVNRNGVLGFEGGTDSGVPVSSAAPVVSGNAPVGSVLTSTTGTWTASPTAYAYQWRRTGTAIAGATASTYTTVAADAGLAITCAVTASNAAGTAAAAAVSNALTVAGAAGNRAFALGTLIADTYIMPNYYGSAATQAGWKATGYLATVPGDHFTSAVDLTNGAFYSTTGVDGNGNPTMVSNFATAGGTTPAGAAWVRFSNTALDTNTVYY